MVIFTWPGHVYIDVPKHGKVHPEDKLSALCNPRWGGGGKICEERCGLWRVLGKFHSVNTDHTD